MNLFEPNTPVDGKTLLIGPLQVLRLSRWEAVHYIQTSLLLKQRRDIAICNANTALKAFDCPEYQSTLDKMTLLNDGIGINIASQLLNGQGFKENLNGTDLLPFVLENIGTPLRIYLLGAKEDQVQSARQHIEDSYPNHQVVGVRNGYFQDEDVEDICSDISALKPDLLLVAMGNPKQEKFIVENRHRLDVGIAVGVGALFDFMSGTVMRAPHFMQSAGLEWLFRLVQEPKRLFSRYVVGIPRFLLAVLKLRNEQRAVEAKARVE